MMTIVKLEGVSKVYGFGEAATLALDDVNFEVNKGEFVAIMGPSGSGKSTLMNIIGLLDHATTGTYHLSGDDVSTIKERKLAHIRRDKIGFIFQSFNLLPRLNALHNVALPLAYGTRGKIKSLNKAAEMLERVGLKERQYYMPNQLSGGQVQRVAVARALINNPSIILADEPTGNLDSVSSQNIMELLTEINKGGNTIIMITHNPDLAAYASRMVHMVDGKIVSDEKNEVSTKKKSTSKKKTTKKEKKDKK
jgi:putative ABC transport system ATP-binding protein